MSRSPWTSRTRTEPDPVSTESEPRMPYASTAPAEVRSTRSELTSAALMPPAPRWIRTLRSAGTNTRRSAYASRPRPPPAIVTRSRVPKPSRLPSLNVPSDSTRSVVVEREPISRIDDPLARIHDAQGLARLLRSGLDLEPRGVASAGRHLDDDVAGARRDHRDRARQVVDRDVGALDRVAFRAHRQRGGDHQDHQGERGEKERSRDGGREPGPRGRDRAQQAYRAAKSRVHGITSRGLEEPRVRPRDDPAQGMPPRVGGFGDMGYCRPPERLQGGMTPSAPQRSPRTS